MEQAMVVTWHDEAPSVFLVHGDPCLVLFKINQARHNAHTQTNNTNTSLLGEIVLLRLDLPNPRLRFRRNVCVITTTLHTRTTLLAKEDARWVLSIHLCHSSDKRPAKSRTGLQAMPAAPTTTTGELVHLEPAQNCWIALDGRTNSTIKFPQSHLSVNGNWTFQFQSRPD